MLSVDPKHRTRERSTAIKHGQYIKPLFSPNDKSGDLEKSNMTVEKEENINKIKDLFHNFKKKHQEILNGKISSLKVPLLNLEAALEDKNKIEDKNIKKPKLDKIKEETLDQNIDFNNEQLMA
mmetsp:Transcript_13087/g.11567  ORF Transcript_13087/g.11567 Transcript_13087/m.11567 type:complete len:123 (+) Transcript_13087:736-1104(+)